MKELETSQHLFQSPLYRTPQGSWTYSFTKALEECDNDVHLDLAAVASFLSFGYVGQSRTLLKEITRRPWLSRVTDKNWEPELETIPPHGFYNASAEKIASQFFHLLCDEARKACQGYNEIYILLSGGLDSRIVAGVLSNLFQSGELQAKPIAVTWGAPDSRDCVYASQIAKQLDFEWINVPFGPEDVLNNIDVTASQLGLMHSPELLHGMLWFKNVPPDSLVLAGSFGDSIGRAEFMGMHLLELSKMLPKNQFALMRPNVFQNACVGLSRDIDAIYTRAKGSAPEYARHEHFMQGYRMRGGLCHALSIINSYAKIYQMFTAPSVYSFMWSLHPVRRNDEIYATLLENYLPEIAYIPWPRINRSLCGPTAGAKADLRPQYHDYTKWSSGPLFNELSNMIDAEWFESTHVFDPEAILKMKRIVGQSQERVGRINDIWLWLAGFRKFVDYIEGTNKNLVLGGDHNQGIEILPSKRDIPRRTLAFLAGRYPRINRALKTARSSTRKIRFFFLQKKAIKKYPPIEFEKM